MMPIMKDLASNFLLGDSMMRYSVFAPRFYNFCKSLGMEAGKIMPSRAFCSDENQGYPVIMLAKHFGTFPFNHGRVGGIVATDRHGPHADHGQDLVILQASHVGYDSESQTFGTYRRLQTTNEEMAPSCGKIMRVLEWFQQEYEFAINNIYIEQDDGQTYLIIDNMLLKNDRADGLYLNADKLIALDDDGEMHPVRSLSTAKVFKASTLFAQGLGPLVVANGKSERIKNNLRAEMFHFKRDLNDEIENQRHLEQNIVSHMPYIVTSNAPLLTAAKVNAQVEFDRTFRSIVKSSAYQGKRVVLMAGLNIDISPQHNQTFPLTKFAPWAAYVQELGGNSYTLEQAEVVQRLSEQSEDNPDQIDLEEAIRQMGEADEVRIAPQAYGA